MNFFTKFCGVIILFGMMAPTSWARTDLLESAITVRASVAERLAACGTEEFNARDPRLPRPLTRAHKAYVNPNIPYLFGYFYREGGAFAQKFEWKRPNGGTVAYMVLEGDSRLAFYTSLGGIQASVSRYFVPGGERFNYLCRGRFYVNEAQFRQCVETGFMQYLTRSFCATR